MKRTTIAMIAAAFAVLIYILLRTSELPSQVTLINQSGHALRDVTITVGDTTDRIDVLRNGEVHRAKLPPGGQVVLTFRGADDQRHGWSSPGALSPYRAMVVTVRPGDAIELAAEKHATILSLHHEHLPWDTGPQV